MRALITGATGFVGARLARELLGRGDTVAALARPSGTGDAWRVVGLGDAIEWIEADLARPESVGRALDWAKPEVVFHLATHYAVDNRVDLAAMIDSNVKAGAVVTAACAGLDSLKLLVNTGTCAEYGDFRGPADETTPLAPNNVYASTKAAQTIVVMQLARDLGVPATTLRLYNMYGEYEKPSRLVPDVTLKLLRGERVELTACEQEKDYAYVGDIARAFIAAADAGQACAGEIVNIGSGVTVPIRTVVDEIATHFPGSAELLAFGAREYRPDEMWFQGTSIEKAKRLLGWEPARTLAEGIARTVAWYRENAALYEGRA